jgi:hypothetical protein
VYSGTACIRHTWGINLDEFEIIRCCTMLTYSGEGNVISTALFSEKGPAEEDMVPQLSYSFRVRNDIDHNGQVYIAPRSTFLFSLRQSILKEKLIRVISFSERDYLK